MIDVSYRDFRALSRILSEEAVIWTEMIKDEALMYNPDRMKLLAGQHQGVLPENFEDLKPVVVQLGGNSPEYLQNAAKILISEAPPVEINLNCGCPSSKVAGKGQFGALMMTTPKLTAECLKAMKAAVGATTRVTAKIRLGVDHLDSYEFLEAFVQAILPHVDGIHVHARKCLLKGLSPAQNRTIPPLDYDRVFRLARQFPDMQFSLNGGIDSLPKGVGLLAEAPPNLQSFMVGRLAMNNIAQLAHVDSYLFGNTQPVKTYREIGEAYQSYLDGQYPPPADDDEIVKPHLPLKPILGLFKGQEGCRFWRQEINTMTHKNSAAPTPGMILESMLEKMDEAFPELLDKAVPLFNPLAM